MDLWHRKELTRSGIDLSEWTWICYNLAMAGWNTASEWKEGNFLLVVCGTVSFALASVCTIFQWHQKGRAKSQMEMEPELHTGYIWSLMEGDWPGAKDGGLGNERLVSRYISLSSLHHQSSFSVLFRGPSVFSFICLSPSPFLVFWWHYCAGYLLSCSKTKHRTWWGSGFPAHEVDIQLKTLCSCPTPWLVLSNSRMG